jgi:hypothetical protein
LNSTILERISTAATVRQATTKSALPTAAPGPKIETDLESCHMAITQSIRELLDSGDRRSIGRADEVAEFVRRTPSKAPRLVDCLWDENRIVVARAANALEKASRGMPAMLQRHNAALLGLMAEAEQKELRWQLALMVPRLQLKPSECARVAAILKAWLEDSSSIVKTFAMQGLADLIPQSPSLKSDVVEILRALSRSGTPAMRARGRILVIQIERGQAGKHPRRKD